MTAMVAMATNTLLGADDDIGDIVDTFFFDVRLARSLLVVSGLVCVATLGVGLPAADHLPGNTMMSVLFLALMLGSGFAALWGVVIAATRLRRRSDRFVVHQHGLAWHREGSVLRIRWVDVTAVTHSGPNSGSRLGRWLGTDYLCRVDRRRGSPISFDSYVINASALGSEIATRSAV